MNRSEVLPALNLLNQQGICVFSKQDLAKLFPDEQEKTFEKSLQRLVRAGILERATKGVYLNALGSLKKTSVLEDLALILRRGHFSYISLESMLSEYGVISQIPLRRITLMTTGAKGVYTTPYGTIEFTHTRRSPAEILQRTLDAPNHVLRVATKSAAIQDLRRVGRNVGMMNVTEDDQ